MEDNNNVVIPSALFLPSPGEEGFGTERRVLRLTYVETAKKRSSNVERSWEIPTYGSCIIGNESSQIDADTCSFQLDVPYSVDEYAPEAPPKGRFSLKRAMDSIDSTVEISSFINTAMLIKCLELIGPINMDGTNNSSILIVSSCQKAPNCNTQADVQSGYLIIHELPINHLLHETSSVNSTFKLTFCKPHFAKLCKLKKGTCVAFEWINPSAFYKVQTTIKDTGILMVILMDDGSISMCKIPLDFANCADNLSPETENKVDTSNLTLWNFDPKNYIEDQMITCIAISHRNEPVDSQKGTSSGYNPVVTVVGGTNDGYIHIWHFEWENLVKAAQFDSQDYSAPLKPCFSQSIPVFNDPKESCAFRRLVSVSFLPCPESYTLAITTYLGNVIVWDIRNATLDGEICAYQSIYRPLTMSKWSSNQQHLMMGGSVVMTVEWQVKPGLTTLSSDRAPNILYKGAFDNICWSMDTTAHHTYFVYDDGLFLKVPIYSVGRRNTQDTMTTYLWEPIEIEGHDRVASATDMLCTDPVEQAHEIARRQFELDLSFILENGVRVTLNGRAHRARKGSKATPGRLIRSKALSHHCVKARDIIFDNFSLAFTAYGGNTGLIHLMIAKM